MAIIDEKTRRFAANSMFPSFFYAVLGLVLSQVGAVQLRGSWALHVLLGLPGLVLSGLALFRARLHWAATDADSPSLCAQGLVWYLLLLAAGVCIGILFSAGSALLLGIVAALTYLVPWTKIPVCRTRFGVSSVTLLAGAIACMAIYGRSLPPLHLMVTAWMLFIPPMITQLLVMASLDRGYRIGEPRFTDKPHLDVHAPSPL